MNSTTSIKSRLKVSSASLREIDDDSISLLDIRSLLNFCIVDEVWKRVGPKIMKTERLVSLRRMELRQVDFRRRRCMSIHKALMITRPRTCYHRLGRKVVVNDCVL